MPDDTILPKEKVIKKFDHIFAAYKYFNNCEYAINNIQFEILLPLIKETAEKINQLSPKDAQTGPAKRNDVETINSHLAFLSDENQKNIYKILTHSIQNNGKKL